MRLSLNFKKLINKVRNNNMKIKSINYRNNLKQIFKSNKKILIKKKNKYKTNLKKKKKS